MGVFLEQGMEDETVGGFRGDWGFLSNMHPVACVYDDQEFASSEHLYQWLKVPLDTQEGRDWAERIRTAPHGKVAKSIAADRRCPCKVEKRGQGWEDFRLDCMEKALRAKFANPEMRRALMDSGQTTLVEYNRWNDTFWGVCGDAGRNLLGGMLMRLRMEFRTEELSRSSTAEVRVRESRGPSV